MSFSYPNTPGSDGFIRDNVSATQMEKLADRLRNVPWSPGKWVQALSKEGSKSVLVYSKKREEMYPSDELPNT